MTQLALTFVPKFALTAIIIKKICAGGIVLTWFMHRTFVDLLRTILIGIPRYAGLTTPIVFQVGTLLMLIRSTVTE